MIEKNEINNNINTQWKIPDEKLKEYKYGLCKFILDKSYELNLSKKTVACAMQIVNYFFIKNCYFSYDKLTIACAGLTLSLKLKTIEKTLLSKVFDIYILNKKEEIKNKYNINEKKEIIKFKNNILNAEINIMKLFNNSLPDKFPFEYIYLYSKILYPNNDEDVYNFSCKICVDSYFTYANNVYQNYVVALACIFISSMFLDIKNFLDKSFKCLEKMKYIHEKNINEEQFINALYQFIDDPAQLLLKEKGIDNEKNKENYFNSLSLDKKIHPFLKMDDLLECIEMISNFYDDIKKNYNDINKN